MWLNQLLCMCVHDTVAFGFKCHDWNASLSHSKWLTVSKSIPLSCFTLTLAMYIRDMLFHALYSSLKHFCYVTVEHSLAETTLNTNTQFSTYVH